MNTIATTTRGASRIIKGRQYLWWHRLRKLGRAKFVLIGGGFLSPLVTCALVVATNVWLGVPLAPADLAIIWICSLPVFVGSWLWTWSHMEGRYGVTLGTSCPGCGYSREGVGT